MTYELKEDSFHFDIGGIHYIHESVWMIASKSYHGWFIVSHGPEVKVKDKYQKTKDTFILANLQEEADDLYLFNASQFGIEEINKCLEITNYIGNLVKADILYKDLIKDIC